MAQFTTPTGASVNTNYSGDGFNSAYQSLYSQLQGMHSAGGDNPQNLVGTLNSLGDQFSSLFTNYVGRAPTQDELNQFFSDQAASTLNQASGNTLKPGDPTITQNALTNYIGANFQQAAKDYATQQLQSQTSQAQTLANQFKTQGQSAISDTETMLQSYASDLFQKLQPQLLTSLQSQGLLNSGALNEAEAGVQKDLASQSQGFLANANLNLENQANQIAFGGASAPYYYQQANIENQPAQLAAAGQGALGFNNQYAFNTQNFQDQYALTQLQGQNYFNAMHPGFGTNFSNSFGSSFGQNLAQWFQPNAGGSQNGGSLSQFSNFA